jgi:hypothetical protein
LALCDSTACVSSQDDVAGGGSCFAEPWEYDDEALAEAFQALKAAVELRVGVAGGEDVRVVTVAEGAEYSYLRAVYTNAAKGTVDDAEWFLPGKAPQFKLARLHLYVLL